MTEYEDGERRQESQRHQSEGRMRDVVKKAVVDAFDEKLPQIFESLGLDIRSAESRRGIREDFSHLTEMRKRAEENRTNFIKVVITASVSGLIGIGIAYLGIKFGVHVGG